MDHFLAVESVEAAGDLLDDVAHGVEIGAGMVGIYLIIYGIVLIVVMRFAPQGLLPWIAQRVRWCARLGAAS